MNWTIKPANSVRCLLLVCLAVVTTQSAADGVTQVPGKLNGYFYDVTSNQPPRGKEVSLVVVKQGAFKEYLIESTPEGFRCDEKCPEAAHRVPAGSVTLKIVGKKPVSFLDIPLTGIWSEPCNNTYTETDTCTFSLHDLNGRVVVDVNPNIEPGMTYPLPEGGEAMIVKVDTRDNYILLAAHENLSEGKDWLPFNPADPMKHKVLEKIDTSRLDGRLNMPELLKLKSEAAQYCDKLKNGWYLPADKELGLMTKDSMSKVNGLDLSNDGSRNYTWTSTKNGKGFYIDKGNPRVEVYAWSNGGSGISSKYAYEYNLKKNEFSYRRKYQVLCFRRISF